MNYEQKLDLAKAEYVQVQTIIDAFDARAFTIKAWSVTFSLAAIAGAFASDASPVFLVAGLSSILFWFIEAYWKTIQTSFYDRLDALEEFFAEERESFVPMQIGTSWAKSFRSTPRTEVFDAMVRLHVALPHLAVLIIALLLYVAWFYGWIEV